MLLMGAVLVQTVFRHVKWLQENKLEHFGARYDPALIELECIRAIAADCKMELIIPLLPLVY